LDDFSATLSGVRLLVFVLSVFSSLFLFFTVPLTAAVSPPSPIITDVASLRENVEVIEGLEWCRASTGASRDFIASGGCELRTLTRRDRNLGYIKDAVWMRLRLRNSSPEDSEPWLQIGHPRLTEVTVFQRDADGRWRSDRTGYGVPRSERNRVGSYYDVTPLRVAAGEIADVWIRVESRSRVNLETRLWDSAAYRGFRLATIVFMGTAMGSLLFGLTLSLMMLFSLGQKQYGFFAISLVGQFVQAVISSGVFLAFLWPATMPIPIELMSIGGMLTVVGLVGYSYAAMPTIRNFPEEHLALRILLAAVLIFQLVSIFVDYSLGSILWSTLTIPLLMLLSWVSFRAWRQGELFARWIFIAFVALTGAIAVRAPIAKVNAPEYMIDIVIAPIAMLIVVALVLMAMMEKSRNLSRRLMDAELATNAQVDFLSRMSHELRTPLDSVLGNAQLLMRSSEKLRKAPELSGIVNSGRQLLRLIDEILDYAKGSAGALTLRVEPVRLADFLHQLEISSRLLATRARNTFIVQARSGSLPIDDVVLRIDAGRLRQVLDNLIVNAVRHTRDGVITVEYVSSKNDEAFELGFAVIDTGEGIAPEDRERIFRPFERVGRAERYGGKGAGMGLAIVRQLVSLMGGDVGVESTPGLGSIFRFSIAASSSRLKTNAVAEVEPRPIEARGYAGRPRIAFVIDDDPGGRAIFAGLLARAGFTVHEAESGNAAISVFSNFDILDLVVTDQFMPDGDGWAVLESIHRHRPDTPVVMISAAPASRPEGWNEGIRFSAEFLKPVNHNDFLTCVGRLLGLRWTYSSHEERGIGAPPVARPDASELASLREMMELGEVTALREWAQALRRRAPEYSSFADRVEASAADLDFDALEALMAESAV
jgi:signal transduction histidine kinase/CheY-like chemotaxis protein